MPVGQKHGVGNPFNEEEIVAGLLAMIAWAGNASAAARALKESGKLEISAATLNGWKITKGIQYDELREKHRPEMERRLALEQLDTAMLATGAVKLAVAKAHERLENGEEADPARAAANLARVNQSATDKLMTLTSRPTQITESRGAEEIIRSLANLGVIKIPEAITAEAESTTVE